MNKSIVPLAIVAGALIIAGAIIYSAKISSPDDGAKPDNAEPDNGLSVEGEPVLGSPEAKVTVIEFSDFQCPFCARYVLDTFPQIKQAYIDTGKIKMVFKNFPLTSIHENAEKSAEASECANDQGRFWEYKEKLFQNQQALSLDNLKSYAKELGLNESQFNDCLDSRKYANEVSRDLQDGIVAGVTGTPTFFINGGKLVGAQPFSEFQRAIEEKLTK